MAKMNNPGCSTNPCCGADFRITVTWCDVSDPRIDPSDIRPGSGQYAGFVIGATATIRNPDGTIFAAAITDSSGVAAFSGVTTGVTFSYVVSTSSPGPSMASGTLSATVSGLNSLSVALGSPAEGYVCCCIAPPAGGGSGGVRSCPFALIPTTLHLTNGRGTTTLTYYAGGPGGPSGTYAAGWYGCLEAPGSPGFTAPCSIGDVTTTFYYFLACGRPNDDLSDDGSPPWSLSTIFPGARLVQNLDPTVRTGTYYSPAYGVYSYGSACLPPHGPTSTGLCPPGSPPASAGYQYNLGYYTGAANPVRQMSGSTCFPFYLVFPSPSSSTTPDSVVTF